MKVAVGFLLVCVAIPHALAGFGFFRDLSSLAESGKTIGSELVDQVEKHVGKAQKMVEGHRERMKEFKKQAKQIWNEHMEKLAARKGEAKELWKEHKNNLLEKNEELMKQWREKEGLWRAKAEETWTEFRSRVELSMEKVKESIAGIEESLETTLPESPRELMKALKMRLKALTLLLKDLYKSRFEEEVTEEIQPTIPEEEVMATPTEPEVEPEIYTTDLPPEELEPTENTKTPTAKKFTEIPEEEGKDWWEGPEGDGMIGDEESPKGDEDDSLEEESPSEEEDEDDDEGEDEESESEEDESESDEDSADDFSARLKRGKTRAKNLMRELWRKYWAKRTRERESSEEP